MKRWLTKTLAILLVLSLAVPTTYAEESDATPSPTKAVEATSVAEKVEPSAATEDQKTITPTEVPVTKVPSTEAPVTEVSVTEAPVTEVPTTEAPVTEVPTTEVPVTAAPMTDTSTQTEEPADTEQPDFDLKTEDPHSAGPDDTAPWIAAEDIKVGVKQILPIPLQLSSSDLKVTFQSSNKKIVTVDDQGNVKGVAKGQARITITTEDGLMAYCSVTVVKAPSSVVMTEKAVTMGVGEEHQMNATITKNTQTTLTWSSSNPAVCTIDEQGVVTALSAGTAIITVRTSNGLRSTSKITVKKAPTFIKACTQELAHMGVGQKIENAFSIDSGAYAVISYAVSDESVVKIKDNVVTAIGPGEAVITAETYNGLTSYIEVVVDPAPASVMFEETKLTIGVGMVDTLKPIIPEGSYTKLTFASSNTRVLTVDQSGTILAKKAGSATVTVTTHNGKKATCKVTVKSAPSAVTISETSISIGLSETKQLSYSIKAGTLCTVTWETNNAEVVTISEDGVVSGVSVGTAYVRVLTHNGKYALCKVSVYNDPTELTVIPTSETVCVGMSTQLIVKTDTTNPSALTFSSSNTKVATVSSKGEVKAIGTGTATITVKSYNGLEASCEVTVKAVPSSIKLPTTKITLGIGQMYQITPIIPEGSYTAFTYTPYNNSLTVSADGVVLAKKAGTSYVKVTTFNGKYVILQVNMVSAPTGVSISKTSLALEEGQSAKLSYTLKGSTADEAAWTSSDEDIATVDAAGNVTGVGKGTATITVTTYNGYTATCSVTIIEPCTSIEIDFGETNGVIEMKCGETVMPSYKAYTASGDVYVGTVTLSSSDTTIAKIVETGVYAKKEGDCVITITAGTASAQVKVHVEGTNEAETAKTITDIAVSKLGCKYVYSNSGPNTFDCAGLVYYAYKQIGLTLVYSAYGQGYNTSIVRNSSATQPFIYDWEDLIVGDIVCFNTNAEDADLSDHTGLYLGNGKFVHASSAKGVVMISDLSTGYYNRTFSWGRRVLGN